MQIYEAISAIFWQSDSYILKLLFNKVWIKIKWVRVTLIEGFWNTLIETAISYSDSSSNFNISALMKFFLVFFFTFLGLQIYCG